MLKKGTKSIRFNMNELVNKPVISQARKKAIATIAKKHNISLEEAQYRQAQRIAQFQARKK